MADMRRLVEAVRDIPEVASAIEQYSPEESKAVAREIIREVMVQAGISEMEAVRRMSAFWVATRDQAREIYPPLARHLENALKVCD